MTKTTAPIPAWLRRHLHDTGVMVDGVTRSARIRTCRRCHQTVIKGLTEEPCSILATCDPTPLSNLGEALALTTGRHTYDLAYRAGRLELDDRDCDHIEGSPPETPNSWRRRADVLAEHRCHADPLPSIESRIP
jgi:hypothetical protein